MMYYIRNNIFNYTNMKKLYSILLLAALCLGGTMQADDAKVLRIGTNDSQSSYAPVYVTWADGYYCSQILYTAAELSDMKDANITKLAFFLRATTGNGKDYEKVQIRLKEVDYAAFAESQTSFVSIDDATLVFEGTLKASTETTLEVTLTEPFEYGGGTLLVDVRKTESGGGYAPTSGNKGRFQSTSSTDYTLMYNYNSSSFPTTSKTSVNRPDIQFTYETAPVPATCATPGAPVASEISPNSAKLSWEAAESVTTYQYACVLKGAEVDWATAISTAEQSVTLTGLTKVTGYDFYVRSYCAEDDQSAVKKVSFTTEESCFAPTLLGVVEEEITSSSAKIVWYGSGKGETQYQYTYAVYGNTADWTNAVVTDQKEAIISGLTPATPYQVWVRSYCAEADQSEAETVLFTTACGKLTVDAENPWKENFDNQTAGEPNCWEAVQAEASSYYFKVTVSNTIGFSSLSSNALVIDNDKTGYGYAKFPEFTNELNTLQISFSHTDESNSSSGTIDLGYFVGEEFKLLKDYAPSSTKKVEDALSLAEVPAGARLAIRYKSNNTYNYAISIDDIEISLLPSCVVPTGLAVSEVTAASAKIAWESEAEKFALQVSTDGIEFADINGVITNPYMLNGLDEQTHYWVRVKAICGESLESEWTEAVAFTTPCAAKAFGYAENFDGENLAACWENKDVHGMNEWGAYENTARYATTSNIANHATLVSPWITIEAESNPVLFFDWQNTGATAKLSIEAEGEAAAELQDLSEPTGESFASFRLYLTEYKGKTVRFLFYGESSAKSKYFYLDNFQVVEKPLLPPTDLKAEAVEGGASVTWKAAWDEVSWAIQVKATAAEDWTAVNAVILEPAYTLTGLDDETEYEVQVQAIYGENQFSAWTESAVFTTPAKTPTAVENAAVKNTATKRIVNGQLIIELGGEQYNAQGVSVK